jgi:hypothetical chaperone protein
MSTDTLAIDFGTSNSAAAILQDGKVRRLTLETDADTVPTAVFFSTDKSPMRIGTAAASALISGDEGRYMRALKSVLGTSLLHEQRLIGGKRRTLADIITAFLIEVKGRAEAASGLRFTRALSGRPVHFHTADLARDAKAEADLRGCYLAAGFAEVNFMFEPEALATHGLGQAGATGLIFDIGGGTSDFSVFQVQDAKVRILASHGIRLGGTDFDHSVSMAHAMPRLGYGGELKREMGPGLLPVPNHLYVDLSTWAKIPFLYTPETRAEVAKMVKLAVKPRLMRRFATVLREELGHELAFAVERGKINANAGREGARIRMEKIEPDLAVAISPATLDASLARYRDPLREAALETCRMAGVAPEAIGTVVLVGGSSLMGMVAAEAQALCPNASLQNSEPFTAVVDGLALATQA